MQNRKNYIRETPNVSLNHISSFLSNYEYNNLRLSSKEFYGHASDISTHNLCKRVAAKVYNKTLLNKFQPRHATGKLAIPIPNGNCISWAGPHRINDLDEILPRMGKNICLGLCLSLSCWCTPCGVVTLTNSIVSPMISCCAYTTCAINYTCCNPRNTVTPVEIASPTTGRQMFFKSNKPKPQIMEEEPMNLHCKFTGYPTFRRPAA